MTDVPALQRPLSIYRALTKGNGVIVSYATHGAQMALVVKDDGKYDETGRYHARHIRIWIAASGRWTNARRMWPGELLRKATREDVDKYRPDFSKLPTA